LIFVSHDRYFVEKLATKIVEVGHGDAVMFPGTYPEFLWSKEHRESATGAGGATDAKRPRPERGAKPPTLRQAQGRPEHSRGTSESEARKRAAAEQRKRDREAKRLQTQISDLEAQIAEREQAMKEIEAAMSAPGFYDNRDQAKPLIDRHQTLMWELGDLMHQWEELQKLETKN
jgi:ATP-binding cassette subfamily F protein 3